MVDAANCGDIVVQYPGGAAEREAGIQLGAGRSAVELTDDLQCADDALAAAFGRVAPDTWERPVHRFADQPWPLLDLPFLRWREVAIHTTDLGLEGLGSDKWPDAYVEHELRRQLVGLTSRLPDRLAMMVAPTDRSWTTIVMRMGNTDPKPFVKIAASSRDILTWLVGRSPGERAWPKLADWRGVP
jgi:maleylpyruvate isomerase